MLRMPRSERELKDMLDVERFKGRHDVIMSSKYYIRDQGGTITLDDYMSFVRFNTNKWKEWS